ncbi:MAG: mannanase [Bacteroidota bacterium]
MGQKNKDSYITVENGQFIKDNKPFYFLGTNLWYGLYLGAGLKEDDKNRLTKELDQLQDLGITNLRVMVGFEGPNTEPWRVQPAVQEIPGEYNEELLKGLDHLMVEVGKRNMTVVLCLNNFFHWSGGMAQYVSWATGTPIPYPDDNPYNWDDFQSYSARFYSNRKAQRLFNQFVKKIVKRKNSINGLRYKDHTQVLSWQLANEPRGYTNIDAYLIWVKKMTAFLQKKDKNHLVSLGGEGTTSTEYAGTKFEEVAALENLDYLTAHLWIENWSWYDPKQPKETYSKAVEKAAQYIDYHVKKAKELNKPIVFEEFGISRDNFDHHPEGTTEYRDLYYEFIFKKFYDYAEKGGMLGGSNFWSWSGEGIPSSPGGTWKMGDTLTGDPPHENQGWYSIYNKDKSTLKIIKTYSQMFNQLNILKTVVLKD